MSIAASKSRKFYYLVLGIIVFGILMVYNVSPIYAQRLGLGDIYRFVKLQIIWTLVGLLFFIILSFVNLQVLKKFSMGLFIVSMVFLVFLAGASLFYPCRQVSNPQADIPFCPCKNGARRWVNLNPPPLPQLPIIGTFGFQATDLAKFTFVLYLPLLLESKMKSAKKKYEPFYYFLGYTLLVFGLVLAQPNMSNAMLIMSIGISIYFVSGLDLKPLAYSLPVLAMLAVVLMLLIPHTRKRLVSVIMPHQQSTLNELYQSEQILIGLGVGGPFGVGIGKSIQKYSYTPELIGDSIFAIIGEEMGFLGSIVFIAIFAYFTYVMVTIVSKSITLYEKMVGMGVVAWVFFQYIINLYSTLKIITPTGIPIPFISYGGSSMVFAMAGLGLISNIYRRQ